MTTTGTYPEVWNVRLIGQTDLGGHGDCMHVNVQDGFAYVGHMGGDRVGTSIVDVRDPSSPEVVAQILTPPGTHSHKVQVVGDALLVNHEKNPAEPDAESWSAGVAVYDISEPADPRQIGFLTTPGKGVHRMTYMEPPYAWIAGSDEGYVDQFLIVADLTDPAHPVEVGRWWLPGMRTGAGENPTWPADRRYAHHHALVRGDRAYATWWDGGLTILDVADPSAPTLVGRLEFDPAESGETHTALPLPGRDLLVVTDEEVDDSGAGDQRHVRMVDISDERNPRVVAKFPVPDERHRALGGRFGPHNVHEMRPGSYQSPDRVHLTYFNAGLRILDVSDAAAPREVGHFVPGPAPDGRAVSFNDLTVTPDGLIYVTDRVSQGLFILQDEGI